MTRNAEKDTQPAVSVDGLTKRYGSGRGEVVGVDDVSFDIETGSIVGLLGPNGAGKTTTIKSILGLVLPTEGNVEVAGIDVQSDTSAAHRHVSALLEGSRNVYWRLTVRENVKFFAGIQGLRPSNHSEEITAILDALGIAEKADTQVRELSRGQKQKASLACSLARQTSVLVLDEPTLGLDVETAIKLREELRRQATERNRTILVTSHDMDEMQRVCDRILIMNDGEIVTDRPTEELVELFERPEYRVTVERPVSDSVRRRLETEFGVEEWTTTPRTAEFVLADAERIYRLVALLEDAGLQLVSVSRDRPDLEEIFLEVTNESSAAPVAGVSR